MENFKEKYIKYKSKYLNLKNQIGGGLNDLVILSEISNITTKIYYDTSSLKKEKFKNVFCNLIPKIPDEIEKIGLQLKSNWAQDCFLLFYDKYSEKYFIYINYLYENIVKAYIDKKYLDILALFKIPKYIKPTIRPIISPILFSDEFRKKIKSYNKSIEGIIIKNIIDKKFIQSNINNLELKKYLNYFNEEMEIKYIQYFANDNPLIQNFANDNPLIRNFTNDTPLIQHFNNIIFYHEIEPDNEMMKGGNIISSPPFDQNPDGVIFYINKIDQSFHDFLEKLPQRHLGLNFPFHFREYKDSNPFRHIDEIMTFMPYGKGLFKVWIYGDIYINSKKIAIPDEMKENYNNISNILFGSNYELNRDKFVHFDLFLNSDYSLKFPSVFNRLYFETSTEINCYFSDLIGERNQEILKSELTRIKSFISDLPKQINTHYINTNDLNADGGQGGNLHCFIKNILVPPNP